MKTYDIWYSMRGTWTCRIRTIAGVADEATAREAFLSGRFGSRRRQDVVIDQVIEYVKPELEAVE